MTILWKKIYIIFKSVFKNHMMNSRLLRQENVCVKICRGHSRAIPLLKKCGTMWPELVCIHSKCTVSLLI
jgi:hypothetical protein